MTATRAHWAAAVLYNGLARYDEAASAARQATDERPQPLDIHVGAARTRRGGRAHWGTPSSHAMRSSDWRRRRNPAGTEFALGIEARCRALLSDGAAADELYREAIERLSRTRLRPEIARAHLLYGEWLRRENRRVDAREQLRTAHEMLVAIGMEAFAERARKELQATGEKVRKRTVETRDDLTAAGAADRAARPRRAVESGDRRAALPQPADRRVAPAQRVHQARASVPGGSWRTHWPARTPS